MRHDAGRKVLHMINHSMCLKIGIALFTLGFLTMNNGLDGFGVSKLKTPREWSVNGCWSSIDSIYFNDSYDVILDFARMVPVL